MQLFLQVVTAKLEIKGLLFKLGKRLGMGMTIREAVCIMQALDARHETCAIGRTLDGGDHVTAASIGSVVLRPLDRLSGSALILSHHRLAATHTHTGTFGHSQ
jgi:hypothetical protein